MKALLGVVSLLLVLGLVSMLAKKQIPSATAPSGDGVTQPVQQTPQQVKQQVESLLQQPRPVQEEK